jgi:hypothetical protein
MMDTLTDYFKRYATSRLTIHVVDVGMWIEDPWGRIWKESPLHGASPHPVVNALNTLIQNSFPPLRFPGGGGGRDLPLITQDSPAPMEIYSGLRVSGPSFYALPNNATIIPDGSEHLQYIYAHAARQGWVNDARHKAIYLIPHANQGLWLYSLATVRSELYYSEIEQIQEDAVWALGKIFNRTGEAHSIGAIAPTPYPCVWSLYPKERFQGSRLISDTWCDDCKVWIQRYQLSIAKCDICDRWQSSDIYRLGHDEWAVECSYCEHDYGIFQGWGTWYCPHCHRYRRCDAEYLYLIPPLTFIWVTCKTCNNSVFMDRGSGAEHWMPV